MSYNKCPKGLPDRRGLLFFCFMLVSIILLGCFQNSVSLIIIATKSNNKQFCAEVAVSRVDLLYFLSVQRRVIPKDSVYFSVVRSHFLLFRLLPLECNSHRGIWKIMWVFLFCLWFFCLVLFLFTLGFVCLFSSSGNMCKSCFCVCKSLLKLVFNIII